MRQLTITIDQILNIALLLEEDQGTTGSMVRGALFSVCGNEITDEEIGEHVKRIIAKQIAESGKTEAELSANWRAAQRKKNPRLTEEALDRMEKDEDEAEETYHARRVRDAVENMRARALRRAAR